MFRTRVGFAGLLEPFPFDLFVLSLFVLLVLVALPVRSAGASGRPALAGLDEEPRPSAGLQAQPSLSGAGGSLLAAWADDAGGGPHRIVVQRLQDPLAPDATFVLAEENRAGARPQVRGGPGGAIVVWESRGPEGSRIGAVEFGPDGAPRGPVVHLGSPGSRRPTVALGPEIAVVVWEEGEADPGRVVAARWARRRGLLTGEEPVSGGVGFRPRIAAGPGGYLVSWAETGAGGGTRVAARELSRSGRTGSPAWTVAETGDEPDVAAGESGYLVVWRVPRPQGDALLGLRFGGGTRDSAEAAFGIAGGEGLRYSARLASGPDGFAVAWIRAAAHSGRRTVRYAWLPDSGALPAKGTALTSPDRWAAEPTVAVHAGTVFLAWRVPRPEDLDDLAAVAFAAGTGSFVPVPLQLPATDAAAVSGGRGSGPGTPPGYRAQPNPSGGLTRIDAERSAAGRGRPLRIYDLAGRLVRILDSTGDGGWTWEGRDGDGAPVPAGIYFARVEGGGSIRLVRLP